MSNPVKTESLSRPRRISDARLAARLLRKLKGFALPPVIGREVAALIAVLGPGARFRCGDVTLMRADGASAPGAVRVHLAGEGQSGTATVRGYVTAVATIGPDARLLRLEYRAEVDAASGGAVRDVVVRPRPDGWLVAELDRTALLDVFAADPLRIFRFRLVRPDGRRVALGSVREEDGGRGQAFARAERRFAAA